MRRNLLAVTTLFGVLLLAVPVLAHHSFAAEYDSTKPIKFQGKITKVEWTNPHVYFYVDAKDEGGKEVNFAVETGAPNGLYRQGWRKDSLKVGDTVTIDGFRAKDGSNLVNARNVTLPDGRTVFAGTAEAGAPNAPKP
jgi:Family of unknown function (DUF6152)